MHPGQNWFYNRESVYTYLGISDQVFQDAFDPSDYLGEWVSDEAFLRVLEQSLEERQGGYAPLHLRCHHPKPPGLHRRKVRLCAGSA